MINLFISISFFIMGISIIVTKKMPQGKYDAYIILDDFWSIVVGGIFILFSLYIFIIMYKNIIKKNNSS